MNRGYSIEEYDEFLGRARQYLDQPEIGRPLMLSGDIIVGFPTETDEDFEASIALLKRSRYKNCFIFKYSARPGTVAYDRIPDDVPDEVKRRRNNELLAVQAEISDSIAREQIGREYEVFVEGPSKQQRKSEGMTLGQIRKSSGAIALTVGGRDPVAETPGLQSRGTSVPGPSLSANATLAPHTIQLSGRTDGDLIVFFDVPPESLATLTGKIVRVRITEAERLSLQGVLI